MDQKFKPGDLVQLKSGGPKMTVEILDKSRDQEANIAICVWFVGSTLKRETFFENVIKPYKSPHIL